MTVKLRPSFLSALWLFCGNDLERRHGEKRDAPNLLYFFLSGMMGAWWLARKCSLLQMVAKGKERNASSATLELKTSHGFSLDTSELNGVVFHRMNLKYKKQETC